MSLVWEELCVRAHCLFLVVMAGGAAALAVRFAAGSSREPPPVSRACRGLAVSGLASGTSSTMPC